MNWTEGGLPRHSRTSSSRREAARWNHALSRTITKLQSIATQSSLPNNPLPHETNMQGTSRKRQREASKLPAESAPPSSPDQPCHAQVTSAAAALTAWEASPETLHQHDAGNQRENFESEAVTRANDLAAKRRRLLMRSDWVGTAIQKPLAIVFPAQQLGSKKTKWRTARSGYNTTRVSKLSPRQTQPRELDIAARIKPLQENAGQRLCRPPRVPPSDPWSSSSLPQVIRACSLEQIFSSPRPHHCVVAAREMIHVESEPEHLHHPAPIRMAQLHRLDPGSAMKQESLSRAQRERHLQEGGKLQPRMQPSKLSPPPSPRTLAELGSEECPPLKPTAKHQRETFIFAQPKTFVGRLATAMVPPKMESLIPLSVREAPKKRGRMRRKAKDGRISIRAIGNYSDDPIE